MHTNLHYNISDKPACLIASVSGRSLAQAAYRAGWQPNVIDLFDDVDTQAVSNQTFAADWDNSGFAVTSLKEAAAKLDPAAVMPVVYGGGFECTPDRLNELCGSRQLIGNPPELVAFLQSPNELTALLGRLNIPHPETTLTLSPVSHDPDKWLVKRIGGSGGGHVRYLNSSTSKNDIHYYQQYLPGRSMSAMVLCNGKRSQIVGYSEQWRDETIPSKPFQYGGAVSVPLESVSPSLRESIEHAAVSIVQETGLCGLNTFDIIVNGDEWWLLEINPRPGFTFELHEQDVCDAKNGLFIWHVRTALGEVPNYVEDENKCCKAHVVVYAAKKIRIPTDWRWPLWVTDIPQAESIIDRGSPVCTVHAQSNTLNEAKERVSSRQILIKNTLHGWSL